MQHFFRQAFFRFWETSPALLYATPLVLGTYFALQSLWAFFFFPLFLCAIPSKLIPRMTLLFLLPLTWISIPTHPVEGEGTFYVQALLPTRNAFGSPLCYRGYWNFDEREKGRRLPCQIYPKKPLQGNAFRGYGKVEKRSVFYSLKCNNLESHPHFSLAPYRHAAKKKVRSYIARHIKKQEASDFLSGIFTGQIENHLLQNDFCKLGLSHLLAISGLHFALITLFLRRLLFFLPYKLATILILCSLTFYFLFVGNTPSVQRAWIFMLILFLAQLLEKRSYPLNTLGVALIIATLLSPFSLLTLGFQLSFLATFGILLYQPLLKKRLFAFTIAVHVFILPLVLFRFHYFHPHTLLYNLFFPQAAALSLFLLLAAVLIPPLHKLNALYTTTLLKVVENPPLLLPGIYFEHFPSALCLMLLTLFFVWGVWLRFVTDPYATMQLPSSGRGWRRFLPLQVP
ncbi:MAG: ComEC/Rec2 family competence protein [Chlamydiales bacterium]|nr:ComEC/Rec2 family competence protein [Chlamydiales bacterium]